MCLKGRSEIAGEVLKSEVWTNIYVKDSSMKEIMVPKCSLNSDDVTCSIGAMFGLLHCLPSVKEQVQSCYKQTASKAYRKMGLESNFNFDFTAVLKLDPTTMCYQKHSTRLQTRI